MRIIAGKFRGRKLNSFEGKHVRPTTDRLRERVFSILIHRMGTLDGARVADIFAGTGAMGLEALSRGASYVHFVEKHDESLQLIQSNIDLMKVGNDAKVQRADARNLPSMAEPFDLVFMDPPYGRDLEGPALQSLIASHWVKPSSLVFLEVPLDAAFEAPEGFDVIDERKQGKTRFYLLEAN